MSEKSLEERQDEMRERMAKGKNQPSSDPVTVAESTKPTSRYQPRSLPTITQQNGTTIVSREELYRLVWSSPSSGSPHFGISDVALAKVCRKHKIPLPGLGYWARVKAGQKVHKPSLPEVEDAWIKTVKFIRTNTPSSEVKRSEIPES